MAELGREAALALARDSPVLAAAGWAVWHACGVLQNAMRGWEPHVHLHIAQVRVTRDDETWHDGRRTTQQAQA